jgi:hypothetical protein
MFSIRKVKTKSGSTAVQVVRYIGHRAQIYQHIGSAKNEEELKLLRIKAKEWIEKYTAQISLFPDARQKTLIVDRGECIGVTHHFAWQFYMSCAKECGLGDMPALLLDLAIMRLIEPASKLRSLALLSHYFGIKYSERIYRNIPKLLRYKTDIEQCAFNLAIEKLKEPFYFVLYDVTTLYFESFKEDELKAPGFSKDNKPQQPQIVSHWAISHSIWISFDL